MKRLSCVAVFVLGMSALLGACTPAPAVTGVEATRVVQATVVDKQAETAVVEVAKTEGPKTLVVGMDLSSAYSLDPHAAFESVVSYSMYQCYDNLVRMTPDNWFQPAPALAGNGAKTPSIIPIGMPGVDPDKAPVRDLAKAKDLLKEAGYGDGFSEKFYYATLDNNEVVAAKIQADLAEVGIKVELMPLDYGQLISRTWGDHDLPWYMKTWIPDYIGYTIWTDWFGFNDFHATNMRCEMPAEIVETTKIISTEMDPEKRLRAMEAWQTQMTDFAYAFNLYQFYETFLVRQDLVGFDFVPGGLFDSYWLKR